jgi:hypothetical protein
VTLPRPPAHVAPFVRALGPRGAAEFLLRFGGAEMHFAHVPTARGMIARAVGSEGAARLAAEFGGRRMRVPLAKPWLARMLAAEGESVARIARRLHWSDVAVRRALAGERAAADARQLRLFG